MKKLIVSFLIAFMVATPVLACCCPEDMQSQQDTHNGQHADHQHHNDTSPESHSGHECSNADVQMSNQTPGILSTEPDSKLNLDFFYTGNEFHSPFALIHSVVRTTPLIADTPHAQRPLFLTTQRLRI